MPHRDMEITPLSDGELHIPPEGLLNRDRLADGFLDAEGLMARQLRRLPGPHAPTHVVVVDTGIGGGAIPELPIGSFPRPAARGRRRTRGRRHT